MVDPFNKISAEDQNELFRILEAQFFSFEKGERILAKIHPQNLICIILSGRVQIIRTDYEGNRVITEDLRQNELFGSRISFIDDECDIIAKQKTRLLVFDDYSLFNYRHSDEPCYHQFILNLLEITTSIIVNRNERIKILTRKTIRNRLLEYFAITAKNQSETNNRTLYLPFSYTDLAEYIATNRSAMYRELRALQDDGLIEIKGRRITMLYS